MPRLRAVGDGTQENCSATWLTVLGFMQMGLVSRLSLASHLAWPMFCLTQPPWWHAHFSVKMDSSEKDSGRLVGHKDWYLFWPLSSSPSYFSVAAAYSLLMPLVACKWLS